MKHAQTDTAPHPGDRHEGAGGRAPTPGRASGRRQRAENNWHRRRCTCTSCNNQWWSTSLQRHCCWPQSANH
eukprot:4123303-Alexandrium_andersonii.AAC.1